MVTQVGKWVKTERERRGWSQTELAQRASIVQSYLSRLEGSDRTKPSPDVLQRLANAFGVTVNEMLQLEEISEKTNDLASVVGEITDILRDLTPNERFAVLEHARALRDRRNSNRG